MKVKSDQNLSNALHGNFGLFKTIPDDVLQTAMATITMSRGVLKAKDTEQETRSALKP